MTQEQAQRVGEVVEASTGEFTAQCYRLYEAPKLGSLIRTGSDDPVYGVVYDIVTQGIDPGRRPIAMGEDEATEEAVYQSNPQITQLLRTDVHALAIGYKNGTSIRQSLPPVPPRIHSFVYQCSPQEMAEFTSALDFLSLLLDARITASDQVITAFLKESSEAHEDGREFLVLAGKELAFLLSRQMQRLNTILRGLAV